jgi:hypothetical protein
MFPTKRFVRAATIGQSGFQSCNRCPLLLRLIPPSLAFVLVWLMPADLLHAQTNLAGISGTITDSSGALFVSVPAFGHVHDNGLSARVSGLNHSG